MLNFIQGETRFLSDRLETHGSVVRVAFKYRLDERHQTDLLSKESVVFLEDGLGSRGKYKIQSNQPTAIPLWGIRGQEPQICRCSLR